MQQQNYRIFVVLILLILALAACNQADEATPTPVVLSGSPPPIDVTTGPTEVVAVIVTPTAGTGADQGTEAETTSTEAASEAPTTEAGAGSEDSDQPPEGEEAAMQETGATEAEGTGEASSGQAQATTEATGTGESEGTTEAEATEEATGTGEAEVTAESEDTAEAEGTEESAPEQATAEATGTGEAEATAESEGTTEAEETEEAASGQAQATTEATEEAQTASTPSPQDQVAQSQVAVPGDSLPNPVSIQLVKVTDGFIDPINVVSPRDGSGRLFVVERNGVVRIVGQDGQLAEEPFLDISDQVLSAFLEQGLYDIEFHPDFAQNGRFFVHFSELLRNGDSMIVEYQVSADNPDVANPDSARVIMQIEQPWANHNGGELAFGPDGYLYIGSGDGGWEGDPLGAGQDLSTLLGKILRVDVNNTDGRPYAIPQNNPFVSARTPQLVQLFGVTEQEFSQIHTEARPEIWAYGLRNSWKFSFDRETGDLYHPDVGQNHWEEINFQPADSQGGENYGWDTLMGSHCFPIDQEQCAQVGVLPVAEYNHEEHGGCAIIGIGIYRGEDFPALDGIYFSGDYCSGIIWGLTRDGDGNWAYAQLLDTNLQLTGSGEDEAGNLYVTSCNCNYGGPAPVDNPPGSLWRLVTEDQVPEEAETAAVEG